MIILHKIPKESIISSKLLQFIIAWQNFYPNRFPLRVTRSSNIIEYEDFGSWNIIPEVSVTDWIRSSRHYLDLDDTSLILWNGVKII